MIEINKDFGYYGTMHNWFDDEQHVDSIWDVTVKRLQQLYPEKSEEDIIEFLNCSAGRHLAEEIIDGPASITYAIAMMKIALLNKIKLGRWWAFHYNIIPVLPPIDKKALYISAIKNEMRKKYVRELMIDVIGCNNDDVWQTPEMWLKADDTTAKDLEIMWGYIQEKLSKRVKTNGHTKNTSTEIACG